jgi:glutathione synthase/RimK-type ligase-like ATP-grasp enzyme
MSLCIIGQEKSESNIKLLEEAKKYFERVYFAPITGINIGLNDSFYIKHKQSDLLNFDAIMPRVPRKFYSYAYQLLSLFPQDKFIAIPPISFLIAAERFFLLTVLRKRGIPVLGLKLARSPEAASRILEEVKFPIIIRPPGEKTGIIAEKPLEAKSFIDALGSLDKPVLVEEPIKDLVSVYIADPEVLAGVKKQTKEKDVVFGGGSMKKTKLDYDLKNLAIDTAKAMNVQIARIDISTHKDLKVANIELNPDLITPSRVTGVDIPQKMMETIHDTYSNHKKKPMLIKFFEDAKSVVRDVFKEKQLL